jgi:hypothetical protein
MNQGFSFLSNSEVKYLQGKFDDLANDDGKNISFEAFREIVLSYNKFKKGTVLNLLDKIKKTLKEGMSSQSEGKMEISNTYSFKLSRSR